MALNVVPPIKETNRCVERYSFCDVDNLKKP